MNNALFSVVVPCYNEEKNLPLIAEAFSKEVGEKNFELVLVNNGSTDGSAEVLKALGKKFSFIRTMTLEKNTGYGFGVWSGLKNASGEFLAWTHADMQTPPRDVMKGFEIMQGSDNQKMVFVKGKRLKRKIVDGFLAFCMSVFCRLTLGKWLDDINAQPNVFHRSFLEKMASPPTDFSFDLYAFYIAKKNGFKIKRFGVEFLERIHGKSSWNTGIKGKLKLIKRTIDFTLKLRRNLND
ncbi:MAG: glycosyltransferase family 2 protein [archaeon]|nr:glycosyltransferase family 2 protein [archaeon]